MNSDEYPQVSIIIITFNSGDTIKRCLSSVFEVNYPRDKYEVIVVDAGSTDRTLELVKKFPVNKLIVEKGALRGKARNIGVREATGEILAMIDSDLTALNNDWLVKAVREFNDQNVGVVRGDDLIPIPREDMNFFQRALFFMSIAPSRMVSKGEECHGK